jgi:hypothetical protein
MRRETHTIRLHKNMLEDDTSHFQSCHKRWTERRNRKQESPDYKDEWYQEQCFACKFYVALVGAFVEDYGACTNENSPFDKQVMFEHDGCEHFVYGLNE